MMAAHTDDRATVTMAQSNLLPLNQEPKSLESVQSGGDRYAVNRQIPFDKIVSKLVSNVLLTIQVFDIDYLACV